MLNRFVLTLQPNKYCKFLKIYKCVSINLCFFENVILNYAKVLVLCFMNCRLALKSLTMYIIFYLGKCPLLEPEIWDPPPDATAGPRSSGRQQLYHVAQVDNSCTT